MPRTGNIRRLPLGFSRQNSTSPPRHRPKPEIGSNSKILHRFVRIHHKTTNRPYAPSSTQKRERKHKILLAKNGHSTGSEVTAVPNPMPDTGFRSLPIPTSGLSLVSTSAHSQPVHSVPLSQTGLPSPSLGPSPTESALTQTPSIPTFMPVTTSYVSSEPPSAAEVHPNQATTQPRRLSIPLIILLAVGCALLVIGIFSLTKYYLRPTSRPRPRPSLPVLDDPFADDKEFPLDDSPVFGGKERMSNGIWSWSHYSQPETVVTKPPNVAQPRVPSRENSYQYDSMDHSSRLQGGSTSNSRPCWRTQSTYSGHGYTQSVPTVTSGNSPFQASLQQLQGALSRTATRVSTASTSFYPSSPQPGNVGLAITRSPNTTYTADGSSVLQRSGPKAALDKNRSDMAAEAARGLSSANNRTSEGSHYSGSDVSSPSFLPYTAPPRAAPAKPAGRSRIKSSYYNANSYPRISSNTALASDSNTDASGLEGQASVSKSDARRDRDTRALTQALGLSSPASGFTPPSPQPTLYPDDSLSVVDAKRPRKPQAPIAKKSLSNKDDNRPSLPVISTAMDASAALGSLMLMDYAGQTTRVDDSLNKRMSRTGSSKVSLGGAAAGTTLASAPLKRSPSRSNDKPPSIPLPELLPSLEQMGLEHANPQAYADYRSPTYSIYGMYGDDRKSGAGY